MFPFFSFIEMTTKFNQDMYSNMRAKKNEPLSHLGKWVVRVVEKRVSITPATSVLDVMRTASLVTSVELITPHRKKQHVADKGKEKDGSCSSSSIWDDDNLVLMRAQDTFTAEDLKVFSGMPSNELVGRHIHKLIQVMYLCTSTFPFLFFCIVLKVGSYF